MKTGTRVAGLLFAAGLGIAPAYADTINLPKEAQGLKAPAPVGDHTLVELKGPGKFVAAEIIKQGGNGSDLTFVALEIDGQTVVNASIAALNNWGVTQSNTYGTVLLKPSASMRTVTIGYPVPLAYKNSLKLWVKVSEPGVAQVIGRVIHGQ
jgi:hypothetical protein